MKTCVRLTGVAFLLFLSAATARDQGWSISGISDPAVHVTIIYDNYVSDPTIRTDWGFACVVEYQGQAMLFDTGRDAGL